MRTTTRYLLAFIVIAACGGGDATAPTTGNGTGTYGTGGTGGTGGTTQTPTATATVTVSDDMFSPTTVTIIKGGTVTWNWSGSTTLHNVTFSSTETSGDLSGSATFSKTFNTAGTFTFQCTNHYGMTGTVNVQ